MPTYEYACKSCEQHLEVVQSFTADSLTTCPACGGSLRKVFGNIGISFKGSGFYRNDSRSASNGSGGKSKERAGSGATKETGGSAAGDSGESGSGGSGASGSESSGSSSGANSSSGSGSSSSSGSSSGRPAPAAAS